MGSTVDAYIESSRERFLEELREFLSIPSVSTLPEHKPDIERACAFVAQRLREAAQRDKAGKALDQHRIETGDDR